MFIFGKHNYDDLQSNECLVSAYAAYSPKQALQPYQFEFEELKADEIEIEVIYCGLCHSDLSMLDNDWQQTQYPFCTRS